MNQCIGRGRPGEGCGVTEEPSGATCSRCGGMVLSEAALALAEELAASWLDCSACGGSGGGPGRNARERVRDATRERDRP